MVRKILEGVCIRKTSKYIPQASLWISRLFIELANRNDKVCLTLDCSNKNKDGPGRFRTEADNPDSQFWYFNSHNDEQVYNQFVSKRIKNSESENNFHFEIVEVVSKTNKKFSTANKLQELNNDTPSSRSSEASRIRAKTISGESATGKKRCSSSSEYSESTTGDNNIVRKRGKPGYLLKR